MPTRRPLCEMTVTSQCFLRPSSRARKDIRVTGGTQHTSYILALLLSHHVTLSMSPGLYDPLFPHMWCWICKDGEDKEPVNSISASQDYCTNHVRIQMGKNLVWAQVALCYSNHVNFTLSIIQPTSFITERPTIKSTKKRNGQTYLSERCVPF